MQKSWMPVGVGGQGIAPSWILKFTYMIVISNDFGGGKKVYFVPNDIN